MPGLPAILHVDSRLCLIAGGGGVALRRTRALLDAGATVRVVAPEVDQAISELPVELHLRPYESADLADVYLVVIATDDPAINARIAKDAAGRGVLVNRADAPTAGDLSIPAHAHHGPVTLAVDTGGVSASAAAAIRRELSAALDPMWAELLALAADYRARIQAATDDADERTGRLRALADRQAIEAYRQGGVAALRRYYDTLIQQSPSAANADPT